MLPFAAAQLDGTSSDASTPGAIVLAALYFASAPLGVRGFLNAVFVNIHRRIQQQELMGAVLSGRPMLAYACRLPPHSWCAASTASWRGFAVRRAATLLREHPAKDGGDGRDRLHAVQCTIELLALADVKASNAWPGARTI